MCMCTQFLIHLNSFHQWLMMLVCVCVCAFIGLKVGSLFCFQDPTIDYSANSELRKLQFFGAGPKAAVPPNPKGQSHTHAHRHTHTCGTCTHACTHTHMLWYFKIILLLEAYKFLWHQKQIQHQSYLLMVGFCDMCMQWYIHYCVVPFWFMKRKKWVLTVMVVVMICTDLCLFVQVTITMTWFKVTVASNSNGYTKCRWKGEVMLSFWCICVMCNINPFSLFFSSEHTGVWTFLIFCLGIWV